MSSSSTSHLSFWAAGSPRSTGVPDLALEPIEAIHSPLATHVRYRVGVSPAG